MADKAEYFPLMTEASEEGEEIVVKQQSSCATLLRKLKPTYRVLVGIIALQTVLLCAALVALLTFKSRYLQHRVIDGALYSPALEAVEPEIKVFYVGFPGDMSPLQVPSSPELDDAWEDLYGFGISRITKEQASQLPNKTHAIPGDQGHYIAELDVFHNLHCLNMVRKALDPVYYPDWNITNSTKAAEHVSHCVDWIRQSIMCHADTSVIVWQWENWVNKSIVKGDIAHTCRNFTKIQEWAKERTLLGEYDSTVRIDDDIVVPALQADGLQRS